MEARATEVLMGVEEKGSKRAKEKARRMLQLLKGRDEATTEKELKEMLKFGAASRVGYQDQGNEVEMQQETTKEWEEERRTGK